MSFNTAWAGGKNVAIVDREASTPVTEGEHWCQFLADNGHACTVFPKEGPTVPLDPFDVVIDLSAVWSDSGGMLADFMRAGKTVITVHDAPAALGIASNSTVQAWIGAAEYGNGSNLSYTVATDPILGDIAPGTLLSDCGASFCGALRDVSGHPGAKILAVYGSGANERIAILRNIWEGGVSVFLTRFIDPGVGVPLYDQIILNAVSARQLTIPGRGRDGTFVPCHDDRPGRGAHS